MNFTSNQKVFINSLLDQLNFNQIVKSNTDKFTMEYFNQLLKSYKKFKDLANCEYSMILYNNVERIIPKNAILSIIYKDNGEFFEAESFSIFDYLKLEIKIKKNELYDIIETDSIYISASDIANFTYCPVSFAISRSIKYKTLASAKIGLELHETSFINSMIFNKSKKELVNSIEEIFYDESFKTLSDILKNCDILYSGHSPNDKVKYFKSSRGNFIGQPDFILRDRTTNKIFVIEEKYHYIPKEFINYGNTDYYGDVHKKNRNEREKQIVYDNHINQLLSYVYGIADYEIDYGILIYWKYEIEENKRNITKCSFKIFYKNEEHQINLNKIYLKIKSFLRNKNLEFDINIRNPKKCASCVNNILCGHKTGNFNDITLPYNSKYLKINKGSFLESFEKDEKNYIEKLLEYTIPEA